MNKTLLFSLAGFIIALLGLTLSYLGNPPNMGVCVACFVRDISGSLNLHTAETVQYMRPEIFGIIIGAFLAALLFKDFKTTAGSAPSVRFTMGFFMMLGCLVFLGCPLRMVLRIGAGDLNAVVGFVGLLVGIAIGSVYQYKGFALPVPKEQKSFEGYLFPMISAGIFLLFLWKGSLFSSSIKGPGSLHAPIVYAIGAGLIVGLLIQRTRFCFIGMAKHIFLLRNFSMFAGIMVLIITVAVGNMVLGSFNLGFSNQPIAHNDGLWNFLSMLLVGLCGVIITGCPLRQLVAAGSGNSDAVMSTIGMVIGAAVAHNFSLASSPIGPTEGGKIMVIVGIVAALMIATIYTRSINKTA